jgi:hypothetical protein
MLRSRDIFALICILMLSRMAWNDGTDFISSTVNLAFFFPRDRVIVLSPMDVDGDGTKEALAMAKAVPNKESFILQIMDLKPLHTFRKTYLDPFRPQIIFTSQEINDDNAHPIHLTTGQLLIKKHRNSAGNGGTTKAEKVPIPSDVEINDRNRHFFCGIDWHDASEKCGTPCPNGQANECPNDERCFADTSCDALGDSHKTKEEIEIQFELTPGGGMPSIVSLWSNGLVILHALTNDKSENGKTKNLELREMWRYRIFPKEKADDLEDILWEEINILFLDAYSSIEANAEHGMIVVSGSYYPDGDMDSERSAFAVALDAYKGKPLWESHSGAGLDTDEKPLPLPLAKRGQTSFARRRSAIAGLMQGNQSTASASALPNCMSLLKKAVKKEVFPYSYSGPNDAGLAAIHLNQKKQSNDNKNHHSSKTHEEHPTSSTHRTNNKKWHHRFHKRKKLSHHNNGPIQGKPNALVTQTRGGLQIRSLKNGKALCHLALLENNLYSDLNNDGTLDQVQVALHTKTHQPSDKFIWNLAARLQQEHQELKEKGADKKVLLESKPQLCHALALSGIPAKEEMFSAPICGTASERAGVNLVASLDAISPLVVESLGSRRRNTQDIIVALNNGMVHRLHGSSGKRLWAVPGNHNANFPTWEEASNHKALLTRIQSNQVALPIRPLLLAGENSLAILSAKTGSVLASAVFPQISELTPILADVSGDGSTDVIISTKDGIWGYQIVVNRGSPTTLRILVGLLLFALMLATIRNRYDRRDKRSTDE